MTDKQLNSEQTGFKQNRSCNDWEATGCIVIEQNIGMYLILYVGFVMNENIGNWLFTIAQIINLIKATCKDMKCRVIHERKLT